MQLIQPCNPYHAVPAGTDTYRGPDGRSVFKVYFLDVIGRKDPTRTVWAHCGRTKQQFLAHLPRVEGLEGVGFITAFPHVAKAFRFGPEAETVIYVRAWNAHDMSPLDLARSQGYVEFACLAEALIAADEYAAWARTGSVEEYLKKWSSFSDASVSRHDKLAEYWGKDEG